jgi:hypothetical protein
MNSHMQLSNTVLKEQNFFEKLNHIFFPPREIMLNLGTLSKTCFQKLNKWRKSCLYYFFIKSRDSSVGKSLGYGPDDQGSRVRFPAGAGNFCLHHRVQNGSGAHPTSYPMGTMGSFPGVRRPGREANHSPPSSPEVKG